MLQTQVNYWNLVETKRHNLATEQLGAIEAEATRRNAETNARNAEINQQNADVNKQNAETNRLNYGVNLFNATTNSRNADTNARNADINARNADVNARNADINARNAETNAYNASTNRLNYGVNLFNAETQQRLASVAEYNAVTNRVQGEAQLQINAHNAYTNQYTAIHNAALTDEQATAQHITNVTLPIQNVLEGAHTAAETVNQTTQATEHAVNTYGKILDLPGHAFNLINTAFGTNSTNKGGQTNVKTAKSKKRGK